MSTDLMPATDVIEPDRELLLEFEKTPETSNARLSRYEPTTTAEYVEFLQSAQVQVDLRLKNVPDLRTTVERLRGHLATSEWEQFLQVWARETSILWPPLLSSHARGRIPQLTTKIEDEPGADLDAGSARWPAREVVVTDDYVLITGRLDKRIYLTFDADEIGQREFAHQVGCSLVANAPDDVRLLLEELDEYCNEARLDALGDRIAKQIEKQNRLTFTGLITNTGRQPCSVLNEAVLFVHLNGQPRGSHGAMPLPGSANYESDAKIDLFVVAQASDENEDDAPLLVPPGASVAFIAASREPLERIQHGDDLAKKFDARNVKARIGMHMVVGGGRRSKARYSKTFDLQPASIVAVVAEPRRVGMPFRLRR